MKSQNCVSSGHPKLTEYSLAMFGSSGSLSQLNTLSFSCIQVMSLFTSHPHSFVVNLTYPCCSIAVICHHVTEARTLSLGRHRLAHVLFTTVAKSSLLVQLSSSLSLFRVSQDLQ